MRIPRHRRITAQRKTVWLALVTVLMLVMGTFVAQAYVVRRGDTLWQIARKHHTTVAHIMKCNPKIHNRNRIYAGQHLRMRCGKAKHRHHRHRHGTPVLRQRPHGQLNVPVYPYSVSQYYSGPYPRHSGIDLAAPTGRTVRSVARGRVIGVWYWNYSYGRHVLIQSAGGKHMYCHLNSISVRYGQIVRKDHKIGEIGSTGNSTGPHLHFELIVNGYHVNPAPYIWNGGTGGPIAEGGHDSATSLFGHRR